MGIIMKNNIKYSGGGGSSISGSVSGGSAALPPLERVINESSTYSQVPSAKAVYEALKNGSSDFSIVEELPTENISENTIYLMQKSDSIFSMHIYLNGEWSSLGSEGIIDLSDYYNKEEINQMINGYYNKEEINQMINGYYNKEEIDQTISGYCSTEYVEQAINESVSDTSSHLSNSAIHVTEQEKNTWNEKIDANRVINEVNTSDNIPSAGAIKSYVDEKMHTHNNKSVLDNFSSNEEGHLLYNGSAIETGGSFDEVVSELESLKNNEKIIPFEFLQGNFGSGMEITPSNYWLCSEPFKLEDDTVKIIVAEGYQGNVAPVLMKDDGTWTAQPSFAVTSGSETVYQNDLGWIRMRLRTVDNARIYPADGQLAVKIIGKNEIGRNVEVLLKDNASNTAKIESLNSRFNTDNGYVMPIDWKQEKSSNEFTTSSSLYGICSGYVKFVDDFTISIADTHSATIRAYIESDSEEGYEYVQYWNSKNDSTVRFPSEYTYKIDILAKNNNDKTYVKDGNDIFVLTCHPLSNDYGLSEYTKKSVTEFGEKIRSHQSYGSITILFPTDLHLDPFSTIPVRNLIKSVNYLNSICGIDLNMFGGDYLSNNKESTTKSFCAFQYKLFKDYVSNLNVPSINVKGNHDVNPHEPFSDEELYNLLGRKQSAYCTEINNQLFGYYDIPNKDVRVIYLNANDSNSAVQTALEFTGISSEQASFIESALNDAKTKNKKVIFASHGRISFYDEIGTTVLPLIDAFIDGGGQVIGELYGHTHNLEQKTYRNFNEIGMGQAGGYTREDFSDDGIKYVKQYNSPNEITACAATWNFQEGKIYVDHIGLGYDSVLDIEVSNDETQE